MDDMVYYTLAAFTWTFVAIFVSIVFRLPEDGND
jgi:hypothetical protein